MFNFLSHKTKKALLTLAIKTFAHIYDQSVVRIGANYFSVILQIIQVLLERKQIIRFWQRSQISAIYLRRNIKMLYTWQFIGINHTN